MKLTRMLVLVFLVAAVPLAAQTPAPGSKATLVCRVGGSMVWSVITQIGTEPMQVNGKNVKVAVVSASFAQLIFQKAGIAVPRDGVGLAAGVCGWTDRGMTAAEPNRVIESLDGFMTQETVQWGNGSTLRGDMSMSGGHLNPQNKSVFSMEVARDATAAYQFSVVPGTTPKVISTK